MFTWFINTRKMASPRNRSIPSMRFRLAAKALGAEDIGSWYIGTGQTWSPRHRLLPARFGLWDLKTGSWVRLERKLKPASNQDRGIPYDTLHSLSLCFGHGCFPACVTPGTRAAEP